MSAFAQPAVTNLSPGVAESIDRVLHSVRSYLGMDVAFVSEFAGPDRVFRNVDSVRSDAPVKVGGVIPMAEGYCQKVVDGVLPELIPNTSTLPLARVIPETASIPIGAHLSVPIKLREGRVFGTFCCFSYHPNPQLNRRDLELMRTFSQLVARQIDLEIERDQQRVDAVARIRDAVGRGDPQIVFQPICRLDSGRIAGVEALSRFASEPKRGPDVWFNEAELVGLAEPLELAAIRKAITTAASLPTSLYLSVNASPATVMSGKLAAALEGFAPNRLVVENTAHTIIDDYGALTAALAPLRESGVRIAIDDAGAGYASLRHVLQLRPDIIKFDISITRGVDKDPMRRAMVAALVEFARHSGVAITAEGIETAEELAVLKTLGVDKGQGYYFSRPKPAAQIEETAAD